MPIYEYSCSDCKAKFEVLVRDFNSEPERCPQCKGNKVRKIFSSFGLLFGQSGSTAEESGSGACTNGTCAL